jgi:hypothetical protein
MVKDTTGARAGRVAGNSAASPDQHENCACPRDRNAFKLSAADRHVLVEAEFPART